MMLARFALFSFFLSASLASAQPFTVSAQSATYVPLTSGTRVTLQGADPSDNGHATIPIGFAFPYFGQTFTELTVSANGVAFLNPQSCATCDYPNNTPLPSTLAPAGVFAPFWDDLKLAYATSGIWFEQRSGPGPQTLTVEWRDLNHWFATSQYHLTFQLTLSSTGELSFHYGPQTGAGAQLSASIGIESPDGTLGVPAKSCSPSCQFSDLLPNEKITFAAPTSPELSIAKVALTSVSVSGTDLQLTTSTTLRNFSQSAATGVYYALFLSQDPVFQSASAIPLSPATQGPVDLSALGTQSHLATSTVTRPANGKWYVIALADPYSAITEPDETNNAAATELPFVVGVDLVAQRVTGPTLTGPGEQTSFSLGVSNVGVDAPSGGTAGYTIRLSQDPVLDSQDFIAHTGTLSIGARETLDAGVTFAMPGSVPAGQYFWLLELDPSASISEQDESNNIAVSAPDAGVTVSQSDLALLSITAKDPGNQHDPLRRLFFGDTARFDVTIQNLGGATASNAALSLYISNNDTLNALTDTKFTQAAVTVAPGQTVTTQLLATLPSKDRNDAGFVNADYFILGRVFAAGDPEALNDLAGQGPIPISQPGPDLLVRSISGPPLAGVGELIQVTRRLSNAGTRDAGTAGYRYVLSANDLASENDRPLPIIVNGQPRDGGTVALGAGEDSVDSELLQLPADLPEGTWHLAALIDPENQVPEFDERNNSAVAAPLTIVGSPLTLADPALPDAIANRPYQASLIATSAGAQTTFTATGLPAGLTLTSAGQLSGTPTQLGVFAFPVTLSSNGRARTTTAVLRVVPDSAQLAIVQQLLPPIQRESPYDFPLAAQGGQKPYRWSLVGGFLPPGVTLQPDGHLKGTAVGQDGVATARVSVTDALGTVDEAEFNVRVVSSGALVLQALTPPAALVGTEYATDLYAVNANGAPINNTLTWSLISGELPTGLHLDPRERLLLVRGTPSHAGSYPVTIEVVDSTGRADTAQLVFQVFSSGELLTADLPGDLRPGDTVTGQIHAEGLAHLRLSSGALPPGVALDSSGGLSGTVAEDAAPGTYPFTVTAETEGGAQRLGAFALSVRLGAPPMTQRCGCGVVEPPVFAALALLAAALRRRRVG